MQLTRASVDESKYILATYYVKSKTNLFDAAMAIAIGQSVGNPNIRNKWETDELFDNHSCLIISTEEQNVSLKDNKSGSVIIAFPIINTNWKEDGISHLLCQLMGGQLDIDIIEKCKLLDITIPDEVEKHFYNPKYGIPGIRRFTKVENKPILGAIIKPKTGITPQTLGAMVEQLVEGGVNFIKEDEILSNPSFCPLEERVKIITSIIKGTNVIFAHCINGDPHTVLKRAKLVHKLGGNAIHVNVWCGLGVYNSIRKLDLPIFMHFQKSGDKIFTNDKHDYAISWKVVCKLAGLMGVDFIHAGMWGGYMSNTKKELTDVFNILHKRKVMPVLSCGMHPGLVGAITKNFGNDYMANVGGAIHGHPQGTLAGAKAMRQAIDGNFGEEYNAAISKWGLVY